MFKLFRAKPASAQTSPTCPPSAELRGTTTEGYHYALRVERNDAGQPRRLIGWHGSARGGARVEIQCGPDRVWRDLQGHSAEHPGKLIPIPIRHSAGWAVQWEPFERPTTEPGADSTDVASPLTALDAR